MTALIFSFAAGVLTTINPCVLPLLPIVLATALTASRLGPAALLAGLVAGFTIVGVAVGATGAFLGIDERNLRLAVAVLFVLFGLVLLVPVLERRFSSALAPAGAGGAALASRIGGAGLAGQFGVGLLLGAVWAPCSGPAFGAALALAAEAGGTTAAALRMMVFGLGAASVLLILTLGGRALIARRRETLAKAARVAKPAAGTALLLVGLAMLSGLDKRIEAALVELSPDWLIRLTTSM